MKHNIRGLGFFLSIFMLGLVLSGCAPVITGSTSVDKAAFGSKKRFAVVSISSPKTFQGEKSLGQMFKNNDDIPGTNTQPLINALRPKIISSLQNNRYFTLMPETYILSSNAYRKIDEDKREIKFLFAGDSINVPSGYKFFSDQQKYAQLARSLGVDGVISVTMALGIAPDKGGAIGFGGITLGAKSYSAVATVFVVAYDRDGNIIWKDTTVRQAEPSDTKAIFIVDTSKLLDTNFAKFHPSAIAMGGKAMDELLTRFNDTMDGKQVSAIQSMK